MVNEDEEVMEVDGRKMVEHDKQRLPLRGEWRADDKGKGNRRRESGERGRRKMRGIWTREK